MCHEGGAAGKNNSRQRGGSLEQSHLYYPWELFGWSQNNAGQIHDMARKN
jgi:hypothetical protein